MAGNSSQHKKVLELVQASVVVAIIFVMHFTGIGYLRFGNAVAISLMCVPVTLGAVVLGPAWGAFFGGIFGLTSFIECFRGDFLGTLLFGINPFFTVIACFVPRILMGLICGLLFKLVFTKAKGKGKNAAYLVAGFSAPLLNTVLFMSTLLLLFYHNDAFMSNEVIAGLAASGKGVIGFVVAFVGINALFELAAGTVVSSALTKAVHTALRKTAIK